MPEPAVIDPACILLDDVDLHEEEGQGRREMEERNGGMEHVRRASTSTVVNGAGEYKLGSYMPEIIMDDLDDEMGKRE